MKTNERTTTILEGKELESVNGGYDANAGGICGIATTNNLTINNCDNSANENIVGCDYAGGICGSVENIGTIQNCYNIGSITDNETNYSGGVVGSIK